MKSRTSKIIQISLVAMVVVGAAAWVARGRILSLLGREERTVCTDLAVSEMKLVITTPGEQTGNHPINQPIKAEVLLDSRTLDAKTVTADSVTLRRVRDRAKVEGAIRIEADGRTIVFTPAQPLEPQTNYAFYISNGVKDSAGDVVPPYQIAFDTAPATPQNWPKFEKIALKDTQGLGITCVTVGPDGNLWASVDDGRILRWAIQEDGTIGAREEFRSLVDKYSGVPRLIGGFCFDPASTPDNPILWVTHTKFGFINMPDWQGAVSRISGSNLSKVEHIITNLPRSARDHVIHQPSFGPDGALYFQSGSMTSYGDPDGFWGMRKEHPFAAAIVRVDTKNLPSQLPLDVKTPEDGGTYQWKDASAPVQVWASGIRVVFDLNWHSNGFMYAPTNGSCAGGNAPASDHSIALKTVPDAEHDWLFRVEKGGYYGHPNPSQGYYVLNGGNPTAEGDYAEVPHYPIGTKPEKDWKPAIYDFGNHVSANGSFEYRFPGSLDKALLVCRYNMGSDIIGLQFDEKGDVSKVIDGVEGFENLQNPLDLCQDLKTGNLYVSEYGSHCITLLRLRK